MDRDLPDWQAFHPEPGESTPVELSGLRGPTVVLLAGPSVVSDGWAARAAVHLARRRAERRGRLFLADLGLLDPTLHRVLGVDAGEGITDSFLFGASIQRIARPLGGGLLFASAGTPVADPAPVLSNPLWGRLIDGFDRAGAELFLYLTWNVPGRDDLLRRAPNVLLLGRPADADAFQLRPIPGLRVGGFIGPDGGAGAGAEESGGRPGSGQGSPPEATPVAATPAATDAPAAPPPADTPTAERGYPATRPELPRDLSPDDFESLFGEARGGETPSAPAPAREEAPRPAAPDAGVAAPHEPRQEDERIEAVNRRTSRLVILGSLVLLLLIIAVVLWLAGFVEIPGLPALDARAALAGRAVA